MSKPFLLLAMLTTACAALAQAPPGNAVILTNLSVTPAELISGGDITGTVTISSTSPTPTDIQLSDNTSAISTPALATIPASATSVDFISTTSPVGVISIRQITATLQNTSKSVYVKLHPVPKISTISAPTDIIGGVSYNCFVVLASPSPIDNLEVSLTDNSSALTVHSPFVRLNESIGEFLLQSSAVTVSATRQIYASLNGSTKTHSVTLHPSPGLKSVTMNPSTVKGGGITYGTVTLNNPAPAGGAKTTITDNSSAIYGHASCNVGAGETTEEFQLITAAVSATATRQVTANLGPESRTTNLTIEPGPLLTAVTLVSPVKGGSSKTGMVYINAPAPAVTGSVVQLSSNSSVVLVDKSVWVQPGNSSASFSVDTKPVAAIVVRTVSAKLGPTKTANLTILP